MARQTGWLIILASFGWLIGFLHASAGDADPLYRSCIQRCERTGDCQPSSASIPLDIPRFVQMWRNWSRRSHCRQSCVAQSEKERRELGLKAVKYHGDWPNTRSAYLQNVISPALPLLNLVAQLHGWLSFLRLQSKPPPAPVSGTGSYEYAGLWHIQGLLATNAWFWSSISQARGFDVTERLACSSAVALVSYSLVLSIVRAFNLRDEESRVIVAAPILGIAMTHICFLNYVEVHYGLNKAICGVMCVAQLLLWSTWAAKTRHPSSYKVWAVGAGSGVALLLHLVDLPPRGGFVWGRMLWHAISIPLTYMWWSFVGDDARLLPASAPAKKKTK